MAHACDTGPHQNTAILSLFVSTFDVMSRRLAVNLKIWIYVIGQSADDRFPHLELIGEVGSFGQV
jgi:hypothetical protein